MQRHNRRCVFAVYLWRGGCHLSKQSVSLFGRFREMLAIVLFFSVPRSPFPHPLRALCRGSLCTSVMSSSPMLPKHDVSRVEYNSIATMHLFVPLPQPSRSKTRQDAKPNHRANSLRTHPLYMKPHPCNIREHHTTPCACSPPLFRKSFTMSILERDALLETTNTGPAARGPSGSPAGSTRRTRPFSAVEGGRGNGGSGGAGEGKAAAAHARTPKRLDQEIGFLSVGVVFTVRKWRDGKPRGRFVPADRRVVVPLFFPFSPRSGRCLPCIREFHVFVSEEPPVNSEIMCGKHVRA